MINLCVEEYCQNCTDFDPVKELTNFLADGVPVESRTTVYCKYKDRCAAVAEWLGKQKEKGDQNV